MTNLIRVLVVDDHLVVRAGIRVLTRDRAGYRGCGRGARRRGSRDAKRSGSSPT